MKTSFLQIFGLIIGIFLVISLIFGSIYYFFVENSKNIYKNDEITNIVESLTNIDFYEKNNTNLYDNTNDLVESMVNNTDQKNNSNPLKRYDDHLVFQVFRHREDP